MWPRSFLGQFNDAFGPANTQKLLDIFSGTTIEVPARRTLDAAERDIAIYESLNMATTAQQHKERKAKLAIKYDLTEKRIKDIFRTMRRQIGENEKFILADEMVGKLKRSGIRVIHKSKRKL